MIQAQHRAATSRGTLCIWHLTSEERDNNREGWNHCGIQMIAVTHIPLIKCSCLNKKGPKWFQSSIASWEMKVCETSSQTDVYCRGQDGRNTIQIMNQQRNNSRLCYFSWASLYTFDSAMVEALICWQRRTSKNLVKWSFTLRAGMLCCCCCCCCLTVEFKCEQLLPRIFFVSLLQTLRTFSNSALQGCAICIFALSLIKNAKTML